MFDNEFRGVFKTRRKHRRVDTQRGKIYKAEVCIREISKVYPDFDGACDFAHKVVESSWTQKHFPNAKNFTRKNGGLRIKDGRGTRIARGSPSGFVNLPAWARNDAVILHELAHVLNPKDDHHGPHFAKTFLVLVRHFMGKEAYEALKQSFKDHRVRTRPKKLRKPLSEEQKVVLRERMAKARAARGIKAAASPPPKVMEPATVQEMGPDPALSSHYDVHDMGGRWVLICKVCGSRWSMSKGIEHIGNVLKLLDHAASHETT